MDTYNELLNRLIEIYTEQDEKDRISRKLNKTRSEIESIEYRNYFDNFYQDVATDITNSITSSISKLPNSPLDLLFSRLHSVYSNEIDMTKYHAFLDDHLVMPHAFSKLLDLQTNLGGKSTDMAKLCNILAIANIGGFGVKITNDEQFIKSLQHMITGLKNLNIYDAFFSEGGTEAGFFIYWLIYDKNKGELNLKILIDLAEATKGSFSDFKTYIVAYWLTRKGNSSTSIKYFYDDILPNVK
jgi:hypothetical protein